MKNDLLDINPIGGKAPKDNPKPIDGNVPKDEPAPIK